MCEYCDGSRSKPLVASARILHEGTKLYFKDGKKYETCDINFCPICGRSTRGLKASDQPTVGELTRAEAYRVLDIDVGGGRVEFLRCDTRRTAGNWAPWAKQFGRLERGGFLAFESNADYLKWKGEGMPFKYPEEEGRHWWGRVLYIAGVDAVKARRRAPWAYRVAMTDGGFFAFERKDDFISWNDEGRPPMNR